VVLLLLLCVLSECSSTGSNGTNPDAITCVAVDPADLSFCAGRVNWLIPSNLNQSYEDAFAAFESDPDFLCCAFFVSDNYQCIKHFPRCDIITSANGTQVVQITKICESACLFGQQYMDGQCQHCSDEFWNLECGDPSYYASPPAPCQNAGDFDTGKITQTWKWALVGIMAFFGLVILCYWLRHKYREHMTIEQLDNEYARKQRKEQLKNADKYEDVAEEDHTPQKILGRGHPPTDEELKALEIANRAEEAAKNSTNTADAATNTVVATNDVPFVAMPSTSSEQKS